MNISVSLESILMVVLTGVMGLAIFMLKRWIDRVEARSEKVPSIAEKLEAISEKQEALSDQIARIQDEVGSMSQSLNSDVATLQNTLRGFDIAEIAALNQLVRGGKGPGEGGLHYNIIILNAVKHWSRNWTFIAQLVLDEICDHLKIEKPKWPVLKDAIEEYVVQYQRARP